MSKLEWTKGFEFGSTKDWSHLFTTVRGRWAGRYIVQGCNPSGSKYIYDWPDPHWDESGAWLGAWLAFFNGQDVEVAGQLYPTYEAAQAACQRHRDDRTNARTAEAFEAAAEALAKATTFTMPEDHMMAKMLRGIAAMYRRTEDL